MALHHFLLEASASEPTMAGTYEKSFIYYDVNGRLNAWVSSRNEKNITILKAFTEAEIGVMVLQDLFRTDLPIKVIGIESNGCLVSQTGQGILRFSCLDGKITGLADTSLSKSELLRSYVLSSTDMVFPGMKKTDCFSHGLLACSRHETIAKDHSGDPLYPQSLLLASLESQAEPTENKSRWIAIGNSHFDLDLNLVPCAEQLFQIPIINFIVDRPRPDDDILLIAWNRADMVILPINQGRPSQRDFSAHDGIVCRINNIILEDISKSWLDYDGRISFWRDMTNPGRFYTWDRE